MMQWHNIPTRFCGVFTTIFLYKNNHVEYIYYGVRAWWKFHEDGKILYIIVKIIHGVIGDVRISRTPHLGGKMGMNNHTRKQSTKNELFLIRCVQIEHFSVISVRPNVEWYETMELTVLTFYQLINWNSHIPRTVAIAIVVEHQKIKETYNRKNGMVNLLPLINKSIPIHICTHMLTVP